MSTGMQKPQNYHLNKIISQKAKTNHLVRSSEKQKRQEKNPKATSEFCSYQKRGVPFRSFFPVQLRLSGLLLWLHPMINGIEEDLPKQATKMMAGVIVLILDLEKIDLFGLLLQSQRLLDDWISYGRQISWSRSALKQGEASQNALKTKRSFERAILSAKLGSKK